MSLYESVLRPLLFQLDAEQAHHSALQFLQGCPPAVLKASFGAQPSAPKEVFGITFPNPVGLAAGMDKNAVALPAWQALGFGFVEVGTITAKAQPGNEKPRLFRYPDIKALVNRMGFNNAGAEAVALTLTLLQDRRGWPRIPVGINLGKSKVTPLEEAAKDYVTSYKMLRPFGDYFVINVSSPNTPGLRSLQDRPALTTIIRALRDVDATKPLLVKVAPDLEPQAAIEIAELAVEEKLSGLIATNTTLDHTALGRSREQQGGLSGAPLLKKSTEMLRLLASHSGLPIIASGGVMDAAAAQEKFDAGAALVQIYTGFVYRGPALIREIVGARAG